MIVNLSSERAILNIVIHNPKLMEDIAPLIKKEYFASEKENNSSYLHGLLWDILLSIYHQGMPIEPIIIKATIEKLKLNYILTKKYLNNIVQPKVDPDTYLHHIAMLNDAYKKRLAEKLNNEIRTLLDSGASYNDIEQLVTQYAFLKNIDTTEKPQSIIQIIENLNTKSLKSIENNTPSVVWYKTGLTAMDKVIRMVDSNLVIIAGRPGMGKTSFAINLLLNMCELNNVNGIMYSLEMSNEELLEKIISIKTFVDSRSFIDMTESEKINYRNKVLEKFKNKNYNVFFGDKVYTLSAIIESMYAEMRTNNIKIFIIDYLQLINSENKYSSREQEISSISRTLKRFALENNVLVIALSQLNRSLEYRDNKKPMLSDLRESGSLEQDANLVFALYLPYSYGITMLNVKGFGQISTKNVADIVVLKNRNGATPEIFVNYIKKFSVFSDYNVENSRTDF